MDKPIEELKKLVDQERSASANQARKPGEDKKDGRIVGESHAAARGAYQTSPIANQTRQEMLALLRSGANKHFVFFFGMPNSGKTVVLGSMLRSMQEVDAFGKVFIAEDDGDGSGLFRPGLLLWQQIQDAYKEQRFPARTPAGRTIQLYAQFQPHRSRGVLDIVFLEMGGEDLRQVTIVGSNGARSLPIHIDQFLRIPSLRMVFLITASWRTALEDDIRINSFLDYLQGKNIDLLQNRIILLITKWDSYPRAEPVWQFVTREFPNTYNKLRDPKNLIGSFSVGDVIPVEPGREHPDDIISQFIYHDARIVFDRILETFTGRTFLKRRFAVFKFWQRFFKFWQDRNRSPAATMRERRH